MKHLASSLSFLLCLNLLTPYALAQSQSDTEEAFTLRDQAERERIRDTRASQQALFTSQEAQCYARFAVNDCLIEIRARRRLVLGDLRRQEILLNDAQRKRRGAEQLLRSDGRVPGAP
jgi:colicin import membrane protein